jgi:two-component system, OmpR family, response regulator BaeR
MAVAFQQGEIDMASDIIVVEDEPALAALISDYLTASGYRVKVFGDGAEALHAVQMRAPDLLVLDLTLPSLDGLSVCNAIRTFSRLPIIMVTGRVDNIDRALGLELGADDYICKPFSPRELVARVQNILRRVGVLKDATSTIIGGTAYRYHIDDTLLRILIDGENLNLTHSEFRLLAILLRHPKQVYSRAQLLHEIAPEKLEINDRAIDNRIKKLRRKIAEVVKEEKWIESVYGLGYRFFRHADEGRQ